MVTEPCRRMSSAISERRCARSCLRDSIFWAMWSRDQAFFSFFSAFSGAGSDARVVVGRTVEGTTGTTGGGGTGSLGVGEDVGTSRVSRVTEDVVSGGVGRGSGGASERTGAAEGGACVSGAGAADSVGCGAAGAGVSPSAFSGFILTA